MFVVLSTMEANPFRLTPSSASVERKVSAASAWSHKQTDSELKVISEQHEHQPSLLTASIWNYPTANQKLLFLTINVPPSLQLMRHQSMTSTQSQVLFLRWKHETVLHHIKKLLWVRLYRGHNRKWNLRWAFQTSWGSNLTCLFVGGF